MSHLLGTIVIYEHDPTEAKIVQRIRDIMWHGHALGAFEKALLGGLRNLYPRMETAERRRLMLLSSEVLPFDLILICVRYLGSEVSDSE